MFRVVLPPIIRSTYNCTYSIWYLSQHRYCYLPLSWKSWNRFECAVGGVLLLAVFWQRQHWTKSWACWIQPVLQFCVSLGSILIKLFHGHLYFHTSLFFVSAAQRSTGKCLTFSFHSFSSLSYERSKASSKASSLLSASYSFLLKWEYPLLSLAIQ
jgi:hypothetical protein